MQSWGSSMPPVTPGYIALVLALISLVLAAGALALGAKGSPALRHHDGLRGSLTTSAALVAPGLQSSTKGNSRAMLRVSHDEAVRAQNALKGGGFGEEGPSLWCYAVMLPWGYEPGLLRAQHDAGIGIFACNAYAVLSNSTYPVREVSKEGLMDLASPAELQQFENGKEDPLVTRSIGGDLYVDFGGKWHTAMNTDIFIRVWDTVIELGVWKRHAWTVKADPDSVFFPARLRQLVVDEPAGSIYLNNCRFGLHGPLEVLSRQGLEAYSNRASACDDIRSAAMDLTGPQNDADHAFGEDEFLHRCLDSIGVGRVDELKLLLSETACGQESVPCDEGKVTFHPFKTKQDYWDCWGAGSVSAKAWDEAISNASMPIVAKN